MFDCLDTVDCSAQAYCITTVTEICDDGLDNDGDGLFDCLDTVDCSAHASCVVASVCNADFNYGVTACVNDRTIKYPSSIVNITGVGCTAANITLPANVTTLSDCDGNGIIGSLEDVVTDNVDIEIFVDGNDLDETGDYSGRSRDIEIVDEDEDIVIVELDDFDFDDDLLDLTELEIRMARSSGKYGYLIVEGLSGDEKVFTFRKLNSESEYVCVKERTGIDSISSISKKCDRSGEDLVKCDGDAYEDYRCNIFEYSGDDYFEVSGLKKGGVREILPEDIGVSDDGTDDGADDGTPGGGTGVENVTGGTGGGNVTGGSGEGSSTKVPSRAILWVILGTLLLAILIVGIALLMLFFNKKKKKPDLNLGRGVIIKNPFARKGFRY